MVKMGTSKKITVTEKRGIKGDFYIIEYGDVELARCKDLNHAVFIMDCIANRGREEVNAAIKNKK
jgi:hypothetical protein